MLVWQSSGEGEAERWMRTEQREDERIGRWEGWRLSRRERKALEYSMAIVCAVVMSFVIVWLGN